MTRSQNITDIEGRCRVIIYHYNNDIITDDLTDNPVNPQGTPNQYPQNNNWYVEDYNATVIDSTSTAAPPTTIPFAPFLTGSSPTPNNIPNTNQDNPFVSFQFHKPIEGGPGEFSLTLTNTANWKNIIRPGDWISIFLSNGNISDQTPVNPNTYSLRCLGNVNSVMRQDQIIDMKKGTRRITYNVNGFDFGKVFYTTRIFLNTFLLDDIFTANDIFNVLPLKTFGKPSQWIQAFLSLYMGNAGTTLPNRAKQEWHIPLSMFNYFGGAIIPTALSNPNPVPAPITTTVTTPGEVKQTPTFSFTQTSLTGSLPNPPSAVIGGLPPLPPNTIQTSSGEVIQYTYQDLASAANQILSSTNEEFQPISLGQPSTILVSSPTTATTTTGGGQVSSPTSQPQGDLNLFYNILRQAIYLPELGVYKNTLQCPPDGSLWDMISSFSHPEVNQLFFDIDGVPGQEVPTLFLRMYPYTLQNFNNQFPNAISNSQIPFFQSISYVVTDRTQIMAMNLGISDYERQNLFCTLTSQDYQGFQPVSAENLQTAITGMGNSSAQNDHLCITESIKRYGTHLDLNYDEFFMTPPSGAPQPDTNTAINLLRKHWFQNNHCFESGTVEMIGNPYTRVGKALYISPDTDNTLPYMAYITGYTDNWSFPGPWIQNVEVKRGVYISNGQEIFAEVAEANNYTPTGSTVIGGMDRGNL